MENPFELFPAEIWEIILNCVNDSKDIINVTRGLSLLDLHWTLADKVDEGKSHRSPKRFWYIDQVLPLFLNRIELTDVLKLRLVCKQWEQRVDLYLQNQPWFRAYSKDLHKDNPDFWGFLEKNERYKFQSNSLVAFTDMDRGCSRKVDEMIVHSRVRNPFVFRQLAFCIASGQNKTFKRKILRKVFSGLAQFGTHVWYMFIQMKTPVFTFEVDVLLRLLHLAPNLKGLMIEMCLIRTRDLRRSRNAIETLELNLPELPFLETIEIDGDSSSYEFSSALLTHYGPKIRRFEMPLYIFNVKEFKDLLPRLRELSLGVCCTDRVSKALDIKDVMSLKTLLCRISSPQLAKIHLDFCNESSQNSVVTLSVEEDILKWLKRFPNIKYFGIKPCVTQDQLYPKIMLVLKEEGTADPEKDLVQSLQTLKIVDGHGLSYNFLRCFPSLRNLEIRPISCPSVVDLSMPDPIKLKETIQTGKLYESNIWDVLLKLKKASLSALFEGYEFEWHFTRETFEKLKKAGRIPTEPQLHPFRKDIQEFIMFFEEEDGDNYSDSEASSDDTERGDEWI